MIDSHRCTLALVYKKVECGDAADDAMQQKVARHSRGRSVIFLKFLSEICPCILGLHDAEYYKEQFDV